MCECASVRVCLCVHLWENCTVYPFYVRLGKQSVLLYALVDSEKPQERLCEFMMSQQQIPFFISPNKMQKNNIWLNHFYLTCLKD